MNGLEILLTAVIAAAVIAVVVVMVRNKKKGKGGCGCGCSGCAAGDCPKRVRNEE